MKNTENSYFIGDWDLKVEALGPNLLQQLNLFQYNMENIVRSIINLTDEEVKFFLDQNTFHHMYTSILLFSTTKTFEDNKHSEEITKILLKTYFSRFNSFRLPAAVHELIDIICTLNDCRKLNVTTDDPTK